MKIHFCTKKPYPVEDKETLNILNNGFPTTFTATFSAVKYDWFTDDILDFVKNAKTEEDAVFNLKLIMKKYNKRKPFIQRLLGK